MKRTNGLLKRVLKIVIVSMAAITILTIVVISVLFHRMQSMHIDAEDAKQRLVSERSEESTIKLAEEGLMKTAIWASDKVDDEFWILEHDYLVLGEQVKDVLGNPDHYKPLPVEEPKLENQGKYSLQLLYPEGFDKNNADMKMTMGRLANLAPMMEEIVRGNEGYTFDCYISIPGGATLAMDNMSAGKYEDGVIRPYDCRTRPWYKGAVESGKIYFSAPTHSYFYDLEEIVFGMPVYLDGELVAVLEGATETEVLKRKLSERNIGESGFSIIVNKRGELLYSPRKDGELAMREEPYDVRKSAGDEVSDLVGRALEQNTGFCEITLDKERYYAAYAPLESFGGAQIMFISAEELEAPSRQLIADMESISDDLSDSFLKLAISTALIMLIMLTVLALASQIIVASRLRRTMEPLNYMAEKIRGMSGGDSVFEMENVFRTGDEVELLAGTFKDYSERNRAYLNEIVDMTSERERTMAEMTAAAQIQMAMLPRKTGPIYDIDEFEIYGEMIPAKEIGGDLYDYFLIDDDHLAIVIGDVSGKGIPASLFMALVKNTVQSQLMYDSTDVGMVMERVNSILIRESVRSMFVTLWVGVLHLGNGELRFVNAGHCLAAVCKKSGTFTIENDQHGPIAGVFDKAEYKQNNLKLRPGDILYLYTDGVTETHNETGEMFGTRGLLDALNENTTASLEELDKRVRMRVREFANDSEAFDDLTTVCIRYKPKEAEQ